jgi:aspartyl-tRNA(Asn)/glutamyl-tRNA(Gln) amidotransferase subunit B
MEYEAVIGLEVHAELLTQSKMFCSCPVVDSTQSEPNTAVCPVCMGLPGVLPVINQQAVEYAIRVALALECEIANTSIFARKNYFYPDLPKGYQISQYEYPLAEHGRLHIQTSQGAREIRVRRVHLEEDTGKLTHVGGNGGDDSYSLVDLNRAGVALLEIVSEPDMHTLEEVRAYSEGLRSILRCLGVNSGDMEKGVIRFEANVSVRPVGSQELGTRVEIKNLNSFRAMERASAYQIEQQIALIEAGLKVRQETLGWDDVRGVTYSQRSKEEAHDYRYFPEPDLPPLVVEDEWIRCVAAGMPELPYAKMRRYQEQYDISLVDARTLSEDQPVAEFFEAAAAACPGVAPRMVANWITGEVFSWINQSNRTFSDVCIPPQALAELLSLAGKEINLNTAKAVLTEMLETGKLAPQIIRDRGLQQVSDSGFIAELVLKVLNDNSQELNSYLAGKETLSNWFFGQVMKAARGQANPQVLRGELERQLNARKEK